MKKIILVVTFIATIIFSAATCAANDVWVDRLEGVDVYVMDDTIKDATPPRSHDYRVFKVSVKLVKNGQIQEVVPYTFTKIQRDAWKYKTGEMPEGVVVKDTSVNFPARNAIFEFSIKQLGWSYEIRDRYYY